MWVWGWRVGSLGPREDLAVGTPRGASARRPARGAARWAEGAGRAAAGRRPEPLRSGFAQLEPYMDENFISRAFATMGETVMSVKIIRNRLTGQNVLN